MPKYYNLVRGRNIYNRILQSIETANGITFATMNLCKENKSLEPTKAVKEKLILVNHTPMPALYHVAVTSDVYVDSYLQIAIWEEILNDNLIDKLTK